MAICRCKIHGRSGVVFSCEHIWNEVKDLKVHSGVNIALNDIIIANFKLCSDCFHEWSTLPDEYSRETFIGSLKASCVKCFDATDLAISHSIRTIQCKEHELAAAVPVSPILLKRLLLQETFTSEDIFMIGFKYQDKTVETCYLDIETAKRFDLTKYESLPLFNETPEYVKDSTLVCFRCLGDAVQVIPSSLDNRKQTSPKVNCTTP